VAVRKSAAIPDTGFFEKSQLRTAKAGNIATWPVMQFEQYASPL